METHPDGGPPAPLLQVDGITLAFGGVKALSGVGFDVQPGSITAVIGPNGAGKTSLFNTISGFYRPTGGSIRFQGEDITRVPAPRRARLGLGRSFQNIALFRGMTVLDNIKLGRHAHLRTNVFDALLYLGRARREEAELRRDIEERIIDFLEIDHIRHAPVAALSYGLQKRVEMARALAMQPRILMLDEPVAGMNREETEDMARFILDVRAEWGVTVLMVEHDMGMVMDLSDHVVVLNFGQVIAQGTPAVVQADPEVNRAYLGAGDVGELRRRLRGASARPEPATPQPALAQEAA
ncbi:ABC transporter ATP-binding protein [Delftia tsuruhatensis]|uniref:ABC transporter ATP-binding protein n=1 Tax=Delftia TaxID=80865 RepID=UPI0003539E5B|nr:MULTISPECIES: ABC transporter ATP-binding protein [Delftia]PZP67635.1 MAG: ABC transporter ATP-binding protein [Delftia acidovorans]EPD40250.1 branched-chain amino acid transport system ATP-binding protein [Delftia acidovorans CCUG 274B]MCX7507324.1 ABC transporter ATP-binding protein [Delftia tsuruhatensis]MDH0773916.1 ABC transporter ATP-binding protein [Delftia tsuruhatensis]MDH1458505.1 ABC transporter ATP-binding protein [Delftia tsuruhatensis]